MDQNFFAVESSEAPLRSPLTPTFEDAPSTRYPMTSSWAGARSRLSDQDYFGSSDQYHDASSNVYLSYTPGGEPSYQSENRAVAGSSFFSEAYEQTNPQAYWLNGSSGTSDGLPSTSMMSSRSSVQSYGANQTMDLRPGDDFVSPSLLNADTDPDSHWPGGQETSDRVGIGSYDPDAEPFKQDEINRTSDETYQADRGGSRSSKKAAKDQRGKGQQPTNGYANGSSSKPKGRAGSTTSVSGAGETLVQLRTASRKAKRISASYKPATSPEEERARSSHNQVEKQYRNRLNHQFERLLAVLPTPGDEEEGMDGDDGARNSDRRLSKVEVLDMARQHIQMLEKEASDLEQERQELVINIGRMTDTMRGGANGYGPSTTGNRGN